MPIACQILLSLLALAVCSNLRPQAADRVRVDFTAEVQNLPLLRAALTTKPLKRVTVCPSLSGVVGFGFLPHRHPGEASGGTSRYINFVALSDEGRRTILLDLDEDLVLECDESLELLRDPRDHTQYFRTVVVHRVTPDGAREQRYRISIPAQITDEGTTWYLIELVDVPSALLQYNGRATRWLLFDGNSDGRFDDRFGDGLFFSAAPSLPVDLEPYGPHFHPFSAAIAFDGGYFGVDSVAPDGSHITLTRLAGYQPPDLGAPINRQTCSQPDGQRITIGGPRERPMLVHFWMGGCDRCDGQIGVLDSLRKRSGLALEVVGVSLDDDLADYSAFLARTNAEWPQCFGSARLWDNPVARSLGLPVPCGFVLLDRQGRLVARGRGQADLERLAQELEASQ